MKIRIMQLSLLLNLFLLLVALAIFQLTRQEGISPVIWLLQSLPVVILLPGIIQLRRRSFQWLGFIILLYFIRGVTGVLSPHIQWIDITLLTLSVIIFLISIMTSRWLVPHYDSSV